MTSTLILSIHVKHPQSEYWRKLQPLFVNDTIGSYDYRTIVNGDDPSLYPNPTLHIPERTSHRRGIARALKIFEASSASHFLLLDSDCWPVRPDWQEVLNNLLGNKYLYAAPIRTENFDLFPHPCAFYMKREFLKAANFDFLKMANLLGHVVADVGMAMPQIINNKQAWYPLLKTNFVAPHPVYASIYGDLFYHHCAGSRGSTFRADNYGFYDHIIERSEHRKIYRRLTAQLVARPRRFIEWLRGVGER